MSRFLSVIERAGNKLPDPAILFVIGLPKGDQVITLLQQAGQAGGQ